MAPRRRRTACLLAVTALLGAPATLPRGGPVAGAGEPIDAGTRCAVPVFLDDDVTLRSAYDGLRLGLEEANLPRACRQPVATDDDAGWAAATAAAVAAKPPLVVAFGRRAGARVARAELAGPSGRLPCVYVDVAISLGLAALPDPVRAPGPSAFVRAEVALERVGRVVADLLPGRPSPSVLLPWATVSKDAAAFLRRAEAGMGARLSADASVPPDVILDLGVGLGETPEPFAAARARAQGLRVPLVSLDRGRFGEGAAVVVVPDAALLGRVAAEACRRLLAGEVGEEPLRLVVRTTEVWVDLEAAAAEGLDPPIPFLARADRLRRHRPAAAAGGAADGPPRGAPPGGGR